MVFFRDVVGTLLNKKWIKLLILFVYAVYLGFAVLGLTQVREGLNKRNTNNYDSHAITYYDMDDEFFKEYAFSISVMVTGPHLDFSNPKVQKQIEDITQKLENTTYIDGRVTQSWLRDFLDYVDRNKDYDDLNLDVSSEQAFANTLRTTYLADPTSPLRLDVEFSEDNSRVVSARFIIQVRSSLKKVK